MKIKEILQKEIEESNQSRYVISKETGINQGILSKLMNNKSTEVSTGTADKLLDYFGYDLVKRKEIS